MDERKATYRLPHIACEVTAQGVAALRSDGKSGTIGAMHSHALAAGVVTPSLNAQNVQDAHALVRAIEQAITGAGGRGQDVIAVLPDAAVRVTLLDSILCLSSVRRPMPRFASGCANRCHLISKRQP